MNSYEIFNVKKVQFKYNKNLNTATAESVAEFTDFEMRD